ncbi:MAG: class II aldolase/adducin family protein [Woeseiaceae bacterium]
MSLDEGYIKDSMEWSLAPPPMPAVARELETWRRPLYEAGLIGHYDDLDIGYGNISRRCGEPGQFLISGTQTGEIAATSERHYALVTSVDIDANTVTCVGPVRASSEAMTHAAIYALDARIEAVVHVHSRRLWQRYRDELPTTDAAVAYGTPAMAREFARLFAGAAFEQTQTAVMGGHEEGLVSFGPSLADAARRMLSLARPEEPGPG